MNAQTPQHDLFKVSTGAELRDAGIQQAVDHAEQVEPGWSDLAYQFVLEFVNEYAPRMGIEEFLTEDVRAWAHNEGLSRPPSARAWGGVIRRAAIAKRIRSNGTRQVKNPNAHCANATVWQIVREAA